jgi:hypothetical protein
MTMIGFVTAIAMFAPARFQAPILGIDFSRFMHKSHVNSLIVIDFHEIIPLRVLFISEY